MRTIIARFFLLSLIFLHNNVWGLSIGLVNHEPAIFDPRMSESLSISFNLSHPSDVVVRIYDDRGLQIRSLVAVDLQAGRNNLIWDGRDEVGNLTPPEAYTYTITAEAEGLASATYDMSKLVGGAELLVRNVSWDLDTRSIGFQLDTPGRVMIRIGFTDGGALMRSLLQWAPRTSGYHREPWDGFDASNSVFIGDHDALEFQVIAYSLSPNTVIVGPPSGAPAWIPEADISWEATPRLSRVNRQNYSAPVNQAAETRRDFVPEFVIVDQHSEMIGDSIRLRVDFPDEMRAVLMSRRFELGFFLDGKFLYENEIGYLPFTWEWSSADVPPGQHFITVNVWGYAGNFGSATIPIMIATE